MIAEPNSVASLPNHRENGIRDEVAPESTAQNGSCVRSGNIKNLRGKRKIREQCENRRRNFSGTRRSNQLQNGEVVEAVTLFEVVSMGKRAMQTVVDDWIEAYKKDRDVALLDLINFFIQCSGCQGMVTAEMFQSLQNCEVMQKMTETFDEETGLQYKKFMAYPWILTVTWPVDMDNEDYPLIKPGPYWKKFKTNFCEFAAVLVQQCQYSILYDSYLMDTVISLLTGLADSMVRAFRHTSTLAAMKLLTALVNLRLNLDVSKRNLERLYEVEKSRASGKRTNSRLDQLEKKKREYEQKLPKIENMMNAIFKGTFLQRYRDVIPEIRANCIEEMGTWMKMYPDTFLNDSYLKYVGWMLYDKQPEVRLKCLQGLQGIYGQKEFVCKMDLFTSRFKDRIVSMALDKEHEVAVQAMKLLMLMSQNCEDALSSEDCETLYQFVYTTHRPLAVAAGELLYKRLIVQETGMDVCTRRDGKQEPIASQLRTLIIFYMESELHSHVTYLVDSLWDWAVSLLKGWECMTALLLENADDQKGALTKAEESALVEIILATIREAVDGHPPVGRGGTRKVLSSKEKKIQMEDCAKITEHFVVVLPRLLAKYSGDAEKVTSLLQIPHYFDLEMYSTGILEKHLDVLLREVKAIVIRHSDTDVLEACSRIYYVLGNEVLVFHNKVTFARAELVDDLVDQLNQLLDTFWNKVLSSKEKKIQMEDCAKITEHFVVVLPRLLAKYSGDAEKVTSLLQIPHYFDLEMYSTGILEKHLDVLLREVKAIVIRHSDTDVLEACSRIYYVLGNEVLVFHNKVTFARAELVDDLVDQLNQLLDTFWNKREELCVDDKVIQHLSSALERIAALHNAHDLTKWNLYGKMSNVLAFEMEHSSLPLQIILPALQCAYFALLWQLTSVVECPSSKKDIYVLRTNLRHFCHICTCCLSHDNRELREKAFMILCDLLIIISHQDSVDNNAIGLLKSLPSTSLQSKMLIFIQDHVFTEEEEESKDLTEEEEKKNESQKLDVLHLKRCLLAAYCKLIICNVVEMTAAAEIYKHYMKAYSDYGDIIKETLSRSRHNDKIQSAKTLILCLQQLFQKHIESQDDSSSSSMDASSAAFSNIKELARRFSLTFGWDQVKSRESVAMIHKEGIEFAFKGTSGVEAKGLPPNLNFLVILSEFSNKLLKPDKRLVYSYLLRYIPEPALCKGDAWYALGWYRTSLLASEDEETSSTSSLNEWPPISTAGMPSFKRKLYEGAWSKTNHAETTNKSSDSCGPSYLRSLAQRSRKRVKSHNPHHQDCSLFLGPESLKRKSCNQSVVKVEKTAEVPAEDTDVDVVGADQET